MIGSVCDVITKAVFVYCSSVSECEFLELSYFSIYTEVSTYGGTFHRQ